MNLRSALQTAQARLAGKSDAPSLDAERILLRVLGHSESSWLYTHSEYVLTPVEEQAFSTAIEQRIAGHPLAHIMGEWEFYGRPFWITPDVLIPRPTTEELVDRALEYIDGARKPLVIADVGTGSGCIAITLVLEARSRNNEVRMIATDISPTALAVARRNAKRHGALDSIEFIESDMLSPFDSAQGKPRPDLIVSNPPYVPTTELETLNKIETRGLKFEPRLALDGGPDGQRFVEQIKNAGIPALVESTGGEILFFSAKTTRSDYLAHQNPEK